MMRKVFEIMMKDYITVDAFWGIRRVHGIRGKKIIIINLASLASTKAKNEKDNLVPGYSGMIDEIAI